VNKYGVYIHHSHVVKANSTLNITGECALGRPWNAQMRAVFANNYLDDSIRPSGYVQWSATDPRINASELTLKILRPKGGKLTLENRYYNGRIPRRSSLPPHEPLICLHC